ncbi:hypothetical protein SAMN05444156_3250 [Verrucomicrobium sp. GAS474]|uniref:DUF7666 domain-containing protein n=1 Tax=Verrucomicrobium sp. GAS474 TaxID=1882831 RepID=UPI00087D9A5E|nr:hypothetical protein [Verrucomicrobium sp. GAS474]SDT85660.1 hypothetical protein SAMN05444156_0012 [Verrucomicrobium sp. GAS474]SDU31588.1 hypothetical protein SAMN05444156_3250 [Verrucomicrobium sp. GAS474]
MLKNIVKKKITAKAKKPSAPAVSDKTVLVLRSCTAEMRGPHGSSFTWPKEGPVECPDWNAAAHCGNGLHGWLWGQGNLGMKVNDPKAVWLVVEVAEKDIVDLDGKVKFPRGNVIYSGNWWQAFEIIRSRRPAAEKFEKIATGNSGHAAATGNSGHAAATGYSGHAAATGYSGHAAATGDSGHAAATGNSGHAAATGNSGHAAATGNSGHAAATGYSGHAAATGYSGHAAATGYSGHAAATGNSGHAAATGYSGHAAATGNSGHAAATGDYGHAAATGYYGHAAATGNYGHAAATGDYGHAAATGYYGHAAATGNYGIAVALGKNGRAKAGKDGLVVLRYQDDTADRPRVVVGYVGEDGVKADTWYVVRDGKLSEVK